MTNSITDDIRAAEEAAKQKAAAVDQRGHDAPATGPTISPVFQDLLDVQTEKSYDELKKSIVMEGVRDPVVVWKEQNTLVDGHNRLKIAKELGIPCPTVERSFKDEAEVKEWIIRNQLGRRNLTPARFEYYIGRLYNEQKATTPEEKLVPGKGKTAEKLANEFQISEKTVRRLGTKAKGIDMLEKIQGKLAKAKQLSNKPEFTGDEIAAIGTASNATVAAKTVKHIESYKAEAKKKKAADKIVKAAVAEKATVYSVALCEPDFEASGFSITTEPKPSLDKNSAVYMITPDEHLADGVKLLERWGLTFEASFVFWNNQPYDGVYSKIVHQFLLMATKGTIIGPKAGNEATSCTLLNGAIGPAVIKLIDSYHNGGSKKLDMRRGVAKLTGWDSVNK